MIRLTRTNNRAIDVFFLLGLFLLFSMTSFFVVIIGARQYHSISNQILINQETRTAAAYLRETFNQNDTADSVSITDVEGIPVISLKPNFEEADSITYIYAYDGYLKELTISEGSNFSPTLGKKIVKISSLDICAYSSHLYCFTLTDTYGNTCPVYISWNAK